MVRWLSGQKLKINFAIINDRIFKLFWQSHQKQANITNIIQEIYFFKNRLYFELKEISGWIRNSSEKKKILFNAFDFFFIIVMAEKTMLLPGLILKVTDFYYATIGFDDWLWKRLIPRQPLRDLSNVWIHQLWNVPDRPSVYLCEIKL